MSKKSISQIKEEFEQADAAQLESLYEIYGSDERSGVQKLIGAYRKKAEAMQKERMRLEAMRSFEHKYSDKHGGTYSLICGIDEAGRGPLAGPVVAGAVILPDDCEILYLNDSKNSPLQRGNCSMMRSWKRQRQWAWAWHPPQGSMRSISFRQLMRRCGRLSAISESPLSSF